MVIINKTNEEETFEQELVQDMLELPRACSALVFMALEAKRTKNFYGMTQVVKEVA